MNTYASSSTHSSNSTATVVAPQEVQAVAPGRKAANSHHSVAFLGCRIYMNQTQDARDGHNNNSSITSRP